MSNRKLLICYGTRPEWIKVKPIIDELKKSNIEYETLFTGQHKDLVAGGADYTLPIINETDGNRLDSIISSIFQSVDDILQKFTHILVQGDTTSVLALAISSFHRKIEVIHLEAGLRTWDNNNPYPEEFNRSVVSKLASIHLCPTENNKQNLIQEKAQGKIFVTGNTVLDNLKNVETNYDNNVVITLHRRENHEKIYEWFKVISKLATNNPELHFILPIHPNPMVSRFQDILKNVDVVKPLPYKDMINLLANCRLAISDSGGIQEESSFLNKKVIVCRKVTERPESVGVHSFLCEEPTDLEDMFYAMKDDYEINAPCPYGDGNAAENIVSILEDELNE